MPLPHIIAEKCKSDWSWHTALGCGQLGSLVEERAAQSHTAASREATFVTQRQTGDRGHGMDYCDGECFFGEGLEGAFEREWCDSQAETY